jgi:hypothetical protein
MFLQMLLIKILIVYSNANTRLMLGLLLLLTLILNRKMLELMSFIVIVENFHYLKEKKMLDLLIYMQEAIYGFYLSLYYLYWEIQVPH